MTKVHAQRPALVSAAAVTPVTLAEAKAHLRVDHNDEDTVITGLIAAATSYLDGWQGVLGQCLITQSWRQDFNDFPMTILRLPMSPVQSITSIVYRQDNGTETTMDAAKYRISTDAQGAFLELTVDEVWPVAGDRVDAVSVTAVYGYGDAETDVPQSIRHAILLLIGNWYENREAAVIGVQVAQLPMAVNALLMPHRRVGV